MFGKRSWILVVPILLGLLLAGISFLPTSKTAQVEAQASALTLRLPWVSGSFGISGYSYGCGDHTGRDYYAIDFGLPTGTHVAAVAAGTAHIGTYDPNGYGYFAWILHANGYVSLYAHLQKDSFKFTDGQAVAQGAWIANSDNSGHSTGAHLHFALRKNATSVSDGAAAVPEPMSGYYGFKHYGTTHDTDTPTNRTCPGSVSSPSYSASQSVVKKTLLGVEVSLPAISNVGVDNNNPLHPVRWMETQVFNASNQKVVDRWDQITYSKTSGRFFPIVDAGHLGAIDLGASQASGIYYFKIRLHYTLRQQVTESNCAGIYTITNGGAILIPNDLINRPAVALISGDINDDNVLNILDYNILLNCMKKTNCSSDQMAASDLNDDGKVDGVDYNIWLRDANAPPPCS